jgi:hypothetical protein
VAASCGEHVRDAEPVIRRACIPTIGKSRYLLGLVDVLLGDCVAFIDLPDNGSGEHGLVRQLAVDPDLWPHVQNAVCTGEVAAHRTDRTIYQSWNVAMDQAGDTPLALLNDDIILCPGSLYEASRHLSADMPIVGLNYQRPIAAGVAAGAGVRECVGTFRRGGLGAFAFVVAPQWCPRVDPRFRWWYGDDDLVHKALAAGQSVGVALGAPVEHPEPSTSGNQMPWLSHAIAEDVALFRELWPQFV